MDIFHLVVFVRCVRRMWLNALSLETPHLILEDDIQILPGADLWYTFALRAFAADSRIVAASFQKQVLVNEKVPRDRAGGQQWPPITSTHPFLYPLPGSHGFLISSLHVHEFRSFVATRNSNALLVQGLQTTEWYRTFQRAGLTNERMWTQEMVGYMYLQPGNLSTLYPPREMPFAVHCASSHDKDEMTKACNGFQYEPTYEQRRQSIMSSRWMHGRFTNKNHTIFQLDGTARCLESSRHKRACEPGTTTNAAHIAHNKAGILRSESGAGRSNIAIVNRRHYPLGAGSVTYTRGKSAPPSVGK